jgi:hypothetical protein
MSKNLNALMMSLSLLAALSSNANCAGKETMVNFNSKDVSFSYPGSMGGKISSKKVPAFPLPSPDDKPDDVAPAHWEITFGKNNAHLYVFPTTDSKVKNFKAAYPTVADATRDLTALLKKKSAAPTDIPYLPWWDASTPINSRVKYVNFKGGSGVRYVATYQIEPEVVSNDGLIYSMQGLTTDGKYFVSAMVPVRTKELPDKSDVATWSKDKYDKFSKNFADYSKKQEAKLNKLTDDAFTPSIADLDKLVKSISVK